MHASKNIEVSGIHCERLRLRFPRLLWRRWKFYKNVSFFQTHRSSFGENLTFPDTAPERVPQELWLGVVHTDDCPRTPSKPSAAMEELVKNRSDAWITAVTTQATQQNLRAYLAAPGLAWHTHDDLKTAYLKAYVAYLTRIIKDYDQYMSHRAQFKAAQTNRSYDAPIDWRGPAWLDWRGFKRVRYFYNKYWRGCWDQMHRMWLWNPSMESRLRKMIPVLAGKMIDPCLLGPTNDIGERSKVRGNFIWDSNNSMCAIYCRFQQAINFLYPKSHSFLCSAVGVEYNQGRCQGDQCLCFKGNKLSPHNKVGYSVHLRYCINSFNLKRYNETHPMD
ncbi:unnamed protein product [Bemisia tabaci]|uniref:Uncharacterized protein n=1 Tax=Bemisia tabaci TaxID=7038 RepID=A0A9P0A4Q0_BEMTA|nr:unnamed protein product [Bemisia tabaci]